MDEIKQPGIMARDYPFSIKDLHTTLYGEERIRRNLGLPPHTDPVHFCRCSILEDFASFERKGKNWYVTAGHIRITVNSSSCTIITAHKKRRTDDKP